MISITFLIASLILQAGTAPTPVVAKEYFVIPNYFEKYDYGTGQPVYGHTVKAGSVVLWIEETEPLLRAIDVDSGQIICIKASKKELIPLQPINARDGSSTNFPGKLSGISAPQRGRSANPLPFTEREAWIEPLPPQPLTLLALVVEKDGSISRCKIIRSSGHYAWDDLAERSFCRISYKPARLDGLPVAVTLVEKLEPEKSRPL